MKKKEFKELFEKRVAEKIKSNTDFCKHCGVEIVEYPLGKRPVFHRGPISETTTGWYTFCDEGHGLKKERLRAEFSR